MYPIVWFALMTTLCVVYAERADRRLGPQARFYIDWPHAISLALMVIVVSFMIANSSERPAAPGSAAAQTTVPPTSTTTTTAAPGAQLTFQDGYARAQEYQRQKEAREKAEEERKKAEAEKKEQERLDAEEAARKLARARAVLAFHAIGIAYAMFAGFIFWRRENWFPYVLAVACMLATAAYYAFPDSPALANFILVMVAVGFSLLGRLASRPGFIIAYVLLAAFDIFAVWGSDVMSRVAGNYPDVFPTFLTIGEFGWARGIGAGDVIFSAIACNHIHQHRGFRRAAFFAAACTVGILIGILEPSTTPLLIFVSPIAIATLLIPKGWLRID